MVDNQRPWLARRASVCDHLPVTARRVPEAAEEVAANVVGRDAELVVLEAFLAGAESGPATLVLTGAPGIGKTTLWKAAMGIARRRAFTSLTCRPVGVEAQLSFAGLGDLLDSVPRTTIAELPEPQRVALDVALLVERPGDAAPDHRAVGLGLLGVLRRLAHAGPVLVAVDDVQWLDPASLSALAFALRRLESEPVAFLAALRDDELERTPGFERALTDPLPELPLGPISMGALHRLIRTRIGLALARPVLRRVYMTADGNPFYALELARALGRRAGKIDVGQPLPVPGTLRELVSERLAGLTPDTRSLLRVVAALTEPTVALAEAAGTAPDALDDAVDAGVVEVDGERLRFTHPLLSSSVYSALGPGARRALHRRLAAVVDNAEERARHLALSVTSPDGRIAEALDSGARDASRRGAPDAAAELHELAARLTPADEDRQARRRLLAAAECQIVAGDPGRARATLEGLVEQLGPGHERAEVLSMLAMEQTDLRDAVELSERALSEAGDDDALRARTHRNLTVVRLIVGDLAGSRADALAAHRLARRIGDVRLQAAALARFSYVETLLGHGIPPEAEQAVELARELDDQSTVLTPAFNLATLLSRTDRLEEARDLLLGELRRTEVAGNEEARGDVLYHLSDLELRAGDWPAAARYAEECRVLAGQAGNEQERAAALFPGALVDAHRGRLEEARSAAGEGLRAAEQLGDRMFEILHRGVLGFCELSAGDDRAADEQLAPATQRLLEMGVGEFAFFPVVQNHIEALAATGQLAHAEELVILLEDTGRHQERSWALMVAARGRALVLASRGELDAARAASEAALGESERVPQPFERGRTLLVAGTVERRAKQRRPARELLEHALRVFEELSAPLWASRARAELARLGGRRPAGQRLTPTEQRIAELVARGRSNKEVAAETFTTVRTVEGHLTRIYSKFGVRSRAELAHRLASPDESQGVSGISS
jgi:DNA-binding NarL/FixJ family response regulator